jgi:flagellar hook-associated protein 2
MASITSVGLGSGIDANSIVDKLVAVERIPVDNLQAAATKLQTKLSTYGKIQSAISGLRDAAASLTDPSTWNATTVSSGDTAAVSVTSDTTASTGSYSMTVSALATAQSAVSATYADGTVALGSGTLHIDVGSWDDAQTTFTAKADSTTIDIEIGPDDTSLSAIKDKINAAGSGVTATVVTDATGTRLVLRSSATGVESGFRVTASDDDGNDADAGGLSALAFDPAAGITSMTRTQGGANAKVNVNGLELTSTTNSFSNVIQGLTFQVGKITTSAVDVTVKSDTEAIKKAVNNFATAYSSLNSLIKEQTKYDAANKTAATLQGDQTANSVLSGMRAILSQTFGGGGAFTSLTDIGLSVDATGALKVNATKLDTAIAGQRADVKQLFANLDDTTPANNGFGQRYKSFADSLLSFDGLLTTRTAGLQKRISENGKQQETMEGRIELFRKRLLSQYNALDATMSKLNGTSNYVTQQLAAMSSSSS